LRDEVIRLEAQHHVHDAQIGRLEISIRELVAISNEADQIHVDQAANQQWEAAKQQWEAANQQWEAANQQWEADRQQMVWELNAIQSSKGWRFVLGVRRVLHRAKRFARIGRRGGSQQTA
jgi:transketolase